MASLVGGASAESKLVLSMPGELGSVAANTFDMDGNPLGQSGLDIEKRPDGSYFMQIDIRIEDGARNHVEATLLPLDTFIQGRKGLRVVHQESQTTLESGEALPKLVIDHGAGVARCVPDGMPADQAPSVELPEDDRVANVPMPLLFISLVKGEVERIPFQVVLCRGKPKLRRLVALRIEDPIERNGRTIVEVRYGPDIGKALSSFAARLIPQFSFWFDGKTANYLAHRMHLYSGGPEILLIREGVTPMDLGFPK